MTTATTTPEARAEATLAALERFAARQEHQRLAAPFRSARAAQVPEGAWWLALDRSPEDAPAQEHQEDQEREIARAGPPVGPRAPETKHQGEQIDDPVDKGEAHADDSHLTGLITL